MRFRHEDDIPDNTPIRKLFNKMKWAVWGLVFFLVSGFVALNTIYVVSEGHVAIVKYTGKVDRQEDPGMHWKIPLFETYETIEVRQRKNAEQMAAATANQLPTTATVSVNWTVDKESASQLYIQYGGLEQFENRVLDPKLRSASKAAISQFRADQIIRERDLVIAKIQELVTQRTEGLPITISQTQLENIVLPERYLEAVMAKEQAREDAEREKHNLDKQKLQAQQQVQTADAEQQSRRLHADGVAYEKRTLADAESYRVLTEYTGRAEGIALLKKELTPEYLGYLKAQQWNGVLPTTMLGDDPQILLTMPRTFATPGQ